MFPGECKEYQVGGYYISLSDAKTGKKIDRFYCSPYRGFQNIIVDSLKKGDYIIRVQQYDKPPVGHNDFTLGTYAAD